MYSYYIALIRYKGELRWKSWFTVGMYRKPPPSSIPPPVFTFRFGMKHLKLICLKFIALHHSSSPGIRTLSPTTHYQVYPSAPWSSSLLSTPVIPLHFAKPQFLIRENRNLPFCEELLAWRLIRGKVGFMGCTWANIQRYEMLKENGEDIIFYKMGTKPCCCFCLSSLNAFCCS